MQRWERCLEHMPINACSRPLLSVASFSVQACVHACTHAAAPTAMPMPTPSATVQISIFAENAPPLSASTVRPRTLSAGSARVARTPCASKGARHFLSDPAQPSQHPVGHPPQHEAQQAGRSPTLCLC